eukprot:GHVS01074458.1.p1 GENE.GHVS01074458.1~~GHVS01074458.1.p1  ORF type:complete len:417 (-),score=84.53 GHVS01074458.1:322-1572(-)
MSYHREREGGFGGGGGYARERVYERERDSDRDRGGNDRDRGRYRERAYEGNVGHERQRGGGGGYAANEDRGVGCDRDRAYDKPGSSKTDAEPPIVDNPHKIYIGNLPVDCQEDEIRREFRDYGRILGVECKGKFAFVEFERSREAEEAMHSMDGRTFLGGRIIVQPHRPGLRGSRGPPAHQVVAPPPRDKLPMPTGRDKRTTYRVLLFNIDPRASWQDLKDFGRNAGDVNFANVFTNNGNKIGVIEYFSDEAMHRAVADLDGRRLYRSIVHVEEDRGQVEPQDKIVHHHRSESPVDGRAVVVGGAADLRITDAASRSPSRGAVGGGRSFDDGRADIVRGDVDRVDHRMRSRSREGRRAGGGGGERRWRMPESPNVSGRSAGGGHASISKQEIDEDDERRGGGDHKWRRPVEEEEDL